MKNTPILSALVIAIMATWLTGCSTTGSGTDTNGAKVTDANSSAISGTEQTSAAGLGEQSSFGEGEGGSGDPMRVGNQTYYFDYDKSDVKASDRASVEVQARYLASHSNKAKVRLEGYADPRGSDDYNLALGERRAKSVGQVLTIQGVDAGQIETVSYGSERNKLASPGQTEADYQKDRRVEMKYNTTPSAETK